MNNINLVAYRKIDDPIPLIKKGSSAYINSNAVSDQKMVEALHSIKYDSNLLTAIESENKVVMDRFGTTKLSGLDHNSNNLSFNVRQ